LVVYLLREIFSIWNIWSLLVVVLVVVTHRQIWLLAAAAVLADF
jgi:hypothetical protein